MPKDPQKNSLIKLEARLNKLEGAVSVFQDGPEMVVDISGVNYVADNREQHFLVPVAMPNGNSPTYTGTAEGLNYTKFRKGLNPGVGTFLSPFPPTEFNILQTFEEASNLDTIEISGTDRKVFLTEDGKFADNALPYKRQDFIKELNIKWAGQKISSLTPYTLMTGVYSTISPNYQKALSPESSQLYQTGNLWIQDPIANLHNGDEVIWGLMSGSGTFTGDRTGRNMQIGLVGPDPVSGSIPVFFGADTTGSFVSMFGTDTSQNRFIGSGSIRDNSSSRTLGVHFRPANNSTRQSGTSAGFGASVISPYYSTKYIENSGTYYIFK